MSDMNLELFRLVGDGIQILLCGCIVILLLRYRSRPHRNPMSSWPSGQARPFRQEFWLQALKHQSEQSFDNLQQALQSERSSLSRHFDIGNGQWPLNSDAQGDDDPKPWEHETGRNSDQIEAGSGARERYHRVALLATEGLDARRISKRLNLPVGEVELMLKLSGLGTGSPYADPEAAAGPFRHSAGPSELRESDG
jgi:hypothetical protein